MLGLMRPRAAVVVPVLFLLCAAGVFLLVAISITVQPASAGRDPGERTLEVLRALFFAAAGFAFFISLAGFARRNLVATLPQPVERPLPVHEARRKPAPPRAAEEVEDDPMQFTLVALDGETRETRAILDYDSAEALLEALALWRRRHPEEELHVFGPGGVEIASRRPVEAPEARFVTPALRRVRAQLAVGGV